MVIWSILKIIRAGFGFTRSPNNNFIRRVLLGLNFESDKWRSLQFIVIFLICEIIPFLMVLDTQLIKIFKLDARREDSFISVCEEHGESGDQPLFSNSGAYSFNNPNGKVPKLLTKRYEEIKDQGSHHNLKSSIKSIDE